MTTTKTALTTILIAAAAVFAGCASKQQWGIAADSIAESSIEGKWAAPAGSSAAGMIVEIERERGTFYELEVEKGGSGAEPESEMDYPMRLIKFGGTTLVEVEAAKDDTKGHEARLYLYGKTEITADTLTFRPLDNAWTTNYAKGKNVRMTPVPGAGPSAGIAAAQSPELKAMLEAAVADPAAWGPPEVWTRVKE